MASQAEQTALTAAFVASQRLLAMTLTRDLVLLLRAIFSINDPGQSWPATKVALDSLIRERRRQSTDLARVYYRDLRRAALSPPRTGAVRLGRVAPTRPPVVLSPANPVPLTPAPSDADFDAELRAAAEAAERELDLQPEDIDPVEPDDLPDDRVDATLNATGIASYKKAIRAGQTPEQSRDTMAVNLSGAVTNLALEGGRELIHETVMADEEAIGWARVDDGDPCAFCAMLISRGAVYKSADTAGRAKNKQFVGPGMFKFHNHDGCSAVPVFDPNDPVLERADELYDKWLEVTRANPRERMADAWSKYWDNREDKPKASGATG